MTPPAAAVRLLGPGDLRLIAAATVFDNPVDPAFAAAFVADPRHHIAGAIDGDRLVGFASAVDYVHPDKPRELFIVEIGVEDAFQRRGVGLRLMLAILARGRAVGCHAAWVLTEAGNAAANALYARASGVRSGVDPVMWSFSLDGPAAVGATAADG